MLLIIILIADDIGIRYDSNSVLDIAIGNALDMIDYDENVNELSSRKK
jgi:hypothetical protein